MTEYVFTFTSPSGQVAGRRILIEGGVEFPVKEIAAAFARNKDALKIFGCSHLEVEF